MRWAPVACSTCASPGRASSRSGCTDRQRQLRDALGFSPYRDHVALLHGLRAREDLAVQQRLVRGAGNGDELPPPIGKTLDDDLPRVPELGVSAELLREVLAQLRPD